MTQNINVRKFSGYVVIAGVVNVIIFLIAKSANATMLINQGGAREIAIPMVLASTLFALLLAAFVASKIGAKSQNFVAKAPLIGLVFGVVTAIAPFTATEDSKTALALASMHLVAGLVWHTGIKKSINA
jgi:uncharacterized secreted protein with C-terminal beta-propeller domain